MGIGPEPGTRDTDGASIHAALDWVNIPYTSSVAGPAVPLTGASTKDIMRMLAVGSAGDGAASVAWSCRCRRPPVLVAPPGGAVEAASRVSARSTTRASGTPRDKATKAAVMLPAACGTVAVINTLRRCVAFQHHSKHHKCHAVTTQDGSAPVTEELCAQSSQHHPHSPAAVVPAAHAAAVHSPIHTAQTRWRQGAAAARALCVHSHPGPTTHTTGVHHYACIAAPPLPICRVVPTA